MGMLCNVTVNMATEARATPTDLDIPTLQRKTNKAEKLNTIAS